MTMPMELIRESVRNGVIACTTFPDVIWFFPKGPRPTGKYVALEYLSGGEEIDDWQDLDPATGKLKNYGFRLLTWTVHCYRDGAINEANSIMARLRLQTTRDLMRANGSGISVMDMALVIQGTVLVDDAYEERASFDLVTQINLEDGSTEDDTGYFETVKPIVWTNKPT